MRWGSLWEKTVSGGFWVWGIFIIGLLGWALVHYALQPVYLPPQFIGRLDAVEGSEETGASYVCLENEFDATRYLPRNIHLKPGLVVVRVLDDGPYCVRPVTFVHRFETWFMPRNIGLIGVILLTWFVARGVYS